MTIFHLVSESKTAFKVTDLEDSIYNITARFQELKMSTKFPFGGDMSFFDSDKNDEKDTISNVLNAIIDKPFLIKMTILGNIVELNGIDSIFEQALKKFPILSLAQKLQFRGEFMQSFGEDIFKNNLEMATAIYSNNPVEKGDIWTIKRNLESKKADTFMTNYEFKEDAENYKLLIGNGNDETLNTDGYTEINGMPTKYNITDTTNSIIKVDKNTGWIIEGKINELTSEKTEIKDNPKVPGGKKMTMSISKELMFNSK
jgi:hypothetical protein